MSNSTITTTAQTTTPLTTTPLTSTTPITTTKATTPTTQSVITSSVIASTAPATTQLVTSVVSVSASNGTPQPPSTIIVTRVSTPTVATTEESTNTSTSSAAASSTGGSALNSNQGKSSSNGGLSPAGKTAIAVVIPVVVIALLVLAGLFLWRRRKQRKADEDERRKEMEAYGFNPNQDPSLPVVAGVADSEIGEDQSGYRGWGTTSTSNRKASTTLSGGQTQHSYEGGSPGSPTQPTISDHSGDPLVAGVQGHKRESTMDSETIGALGGAPLAGGRSDNVRRGPSNASSHYSAGDHSNHSNEAPIPVSQDYYADNNYFTPGPYENTYANNGQQQPVIRENPARRNTRIQEANHFPPAQQGRSGISQNF